MATRHAVFSVDTEEFFPGAQDGVLDYLDLFEDCGIPATFFVTSSFATAHPELVRAIANAGHELASHGYRHPLRGFDIPNLDELSDSEARADLIQARQTLIDFGEPPPYGYRSPRFRMTQRTFNLIAEVFDYDSSLFENTQNLYAIPNSIREIPVAVTPEFRLRIGTPLMFTPGAIGFVRASLVHRRKTTFTMLYGHSYDLVKVDRPLTHPWYVQQMYYRRCGPHQKRKLRNLIGAMKRAGYEFIVAKDLLVGKYSE